MTFVGAKIQELRLEFLSHRNSGALPLWPIISGAGLHLPWRAGGSWQGGWGRWADMADQHGHRFEKVAQ